MWVALFHAKAGLILKACTHTVMQERIKVEGKAGNLGDNVTVQKEGDGKISVTSNVATSKR